MRTVCILQYTLTIPPMPSQDPWQAPLLTVYPADCQALLVAPSSSTLLRESQGAERGVLLRQDGPGLYNDDVWEALDRVLDEARRAGLKVMLSFLDNWKYIGALSHPCQHHVSARPTLGWPMLCQSPLLLRGRVDMPVNLRRQSRQRQHC